MKYFLLFGAGKSSIYLIEHLENYIKNKNIELIICDKNTEYMSSLFKYNTQIKLVSLDVFDQEKIQYLIRNSEIVISLLPANLHIHIAKTCLQFQKNLCTASYISDEMQALNEEVASKGLCFLNELGLDPGIDHLSAMKLFDEIKAKKGMIASFKSYCGGLVADECDGENPWKYKFTWNPKNVVLAGQGAPAVFLSENSLKIVPYHQLFNNTVNFQFNEMSELEGYPNRDSLKYIEAYHLNGIEEMIRGTLRKKGYCSAWHLLINLGMTDNQKKLELNDNCTKKEWFEMYLPSKDINLINHYHCNESDIQKLLYLGLFSDEKIPSTVGTSAELLEEILKEKWVLMPEDKDLIVMVHEIKYKIDHQNYLCRSKMILKGENQLKTAMAKTVGLPLAIGSILVYEGKIQSKGVVLPNKTEFYIPILDELKLQGIEFEEIHISN